MNYTHVINIKLTIILMASLFFAGCFDEPSRQERFEHNVTNYGAPPDATNIVFLNGEWYTFEWRGQCFLASNDYGATTGTGLLARVDCE